MPNFTSADDEESQGRSLWNAIFWRILDISILCCVGRALSSLFNYPAGPTTFTGTIICPPNNGKVKMFMQNNGPEAPPCMVLEFPISTSDFAVIVRNETNRIDFSRHDGDSTWKMSHSGKGVGLASRKKDLTEEDAKLLEMIGTVTVGIGLLPDKGGCGEHKHLRGQFERAKCSDGSEAYHLVDPFGCFGQELSLFFHKY